MLVPWLVTSLAWPCLSNEHEWETNLGVEGIQGQALGEAVVRAGGRAKEWLWASSIVSYNWILKLWIHTVFSPGYLNSEVNFLQVINFSIQPNGRGRNVFFLIEFSLTYRLLILLSSLPVVLDFIGLSDYSDILKEYKSAHLCLPLHIPRRKQLVYFLCSCFIIREAC
jgi:hypothetical protein